MIETAERFALTRYIYKAITLLFFINLHRSHGGYKPDFSGVPRRVHSPLGFRRQDTGRIEPTT